MRNRTTHISFTLDNELAWALAQFVKRVYPCDIKDCVVDKEESYQMMCAFAELRRALADAGMAPR